MIINNLIINSKVFLTNNSSNINESAKRYAKALMLSSEDKDSLISNFKNDYEKLLVFV